MSDARRDLTLAAAAGLLMVTALLAMTRVFTDAAWMPETLAAGLLAVAVAAAARRARLGLVAAGVANVAALAVFTLVVHLPDLALVPGGEHVDRLAALLRAGLGQFRDQPAPTSPLDGLLLLTTTGAWIIGAVTHAVLVRWRRPLLALVPPMVLWTVPLAVPLPAGRTWPHTLPFLAACALVLLLDADAPLTGWTREHTGPRLSRTGATIGVLALTGAAFLPGILPGYGQPPWLELQSPTDPRGYQPIVDVGDRLQLPRDRDVMEVRTNRRAYLRLAALATFDGVTWRIGPPGVDDFTPASDQLFPADGRLPLQPPGVDSERVTTEVRVLDLANIYVPAPYKPLEVGGPGAEQIIYSQVGGFLATGQVDRGDGRGQLRVGVRPDFRYRVESAVPTPDYASLQGVQVDPDDPRVARQLQLPGDYSALAGQARQVYQQAGADTAVDRALALQRWFAGPDSSFRYSTDVPQLRGDGALTRFVLEDRTGYCEYFATAMAVMLRATGVPARVAVGFLPGERVEQAPTDEGLDTYRVSTQDAHAWVEVLFPGRGWIRFEPTPRGDGATLTPTRDQLSPVVPDAQRPPDDAPTPDPDATAGPDLRDLLERNQNLGAQQPPVPGGTSGDGSGGGPDPWVVVLALLALAGAGGGVAAVLRGRTPARPTTTARDRVLATQDRVLARARRLGLGRRRTETAIELAARWAGEGRTAPDRAARLARRWQAAAFGGPATDGDARRAEELADRLVADLRESVPRGERLLAPVRAPALWLARASRRATRRVTSALRS